MSGKRRAQWVLFHCFSLGYSGLDMSPYMLGDAGRMASTEAPPTYDLYAIVNHYGVVHIGHYTAMVKPPCSEGNGGCMGVGGVCGCGECGCW